MDRHEAQLRSNAVPIRILNQFRYSARPFMFLRDIFILNKEREIKMLLHLPAVKSLI